MNVSMAIMAHPARERHVKQLEKRLPGVPVVWDESNDRWDTGRRALLASDPIADWHVVIQDDAILCRYFVDGVSAALEHVPEVPVSFYTGKTQPDARVVKIAVGKAQEHSRPFFSMRGPLWGVAIAIPNRFIRPMINDVDKSLNPSYDNRIAGYFDKQGIECWYTIPSLVDHRVGPDNPSLVPNRSSSAKRTAHAFIGQKDPRKIDWSNGCLPWLGPEQRKWAMVRDGYRCGGCGELFDRLSGVINHNYQDHNLGPVDFIATSLESEKVMRDIRAQLRPGAVGELFLIGRGIGISPLRAKRVLSRNPKRFTITDCHQATRYALRRKAWSMDNVVETHG